MHSCLRPNLLLELYHERTISPFPQPQTLLEHLGNTGEHDVAPSGTNSCLNMLLWILWLMLDSS